MSKSLLQAKKQTNSEMAVLDKALLHCTQRRQNYKAHAFQLRRMMASLNATVPLEEGPVSLAEFSSGTGSFNDLGTGCCGNRDTRAMLFKGFTEDLGACKAKCATMSNCGHIEYGWAGSQWCNVIPKGTDCSSLADGAADCGSAGGDSGVRTYEFVTTETRIGTGIPQVLLEGGDGEEVTGTDSLDEFVDKGAGCCGNRDPNIMLFKGNTDDLDACKTKCQITENCAFIEYGWKDSKWCTLIPAGTDCSSLSAGPQDCGAGGGNNGVHLYALLSADPEQCQSGSLAENEYVSSGWRTIPNLKGSKIKDLFVTHGGIFNGAYVNGGGKPPEAVRRKKNVPNQWLVGIYEGGYAKMIELVFSINSAGSISVHQSGARYRHMSEKATMDGFSSTEAMTNLWNIGHGQHIASHDHHAGYGLKGLKVKSCLANESAVKAGAEMEDLIGGFIDEQSGSEDACHSQLLEARHQLNQLHALAVDLTREVNSTEEQIMVYDKMLEEKLREMSELNEWREEELKKCEEAKQKAIQMFAKLKGELDEMHSIASPSVAMDVKDGKLHKVSLVQEVSLNRRLVTVDSAGEENIDGHHGHHLSKARRLSAGHHRKVARVLSLDKRAKDVSMISELVSDTRKASDAYNTCVGADDSHMSLSSDGKPKTKEECEAEKDALEKTYVKAYVELSRMKAEYEELANSTSCFDSIHEQYEARNPELQETADKLSDQINEKIKTLQALRPRLDGAKASEESLRRQVQKLTSQCKHVGVTVSDLDKVRNAIRSLSSCPGLSRVKFSMPEWVGTWATFDQNAATQDDEEQDVLMGKACNKIKAGSRAAEVGEIQEQTVEGIPVSNVAPVALIGTCPDCAGDKDESFQSGHGRICWEPGKSLTLGDRSSNCGTGKKAVLCVMDRADVRKIPGESPA